MFKVPKSKASEKDGRFEFQVPGHSKIYSFPKMQFLPFKVMQRMSSLAAISKKAKAAQDKGKDFVPTPAEAEKAEAAVDYLFKAFAPDLLDELDNEQINKLIIAWGEESSVGLGES